MKKNSPENQSNFILYTGNDGKVNIKVFLQDETGWLTQKTMGQLFGVESHTITYHLKEYFLRGVKELISKTITNAGQFNNCIH